MPAVVRAVQREYDKLERASSLDQFGPYAPLVAAERTRDDVRCTESCASTGSSSTCAASRRPPPRPPRAQLGPALARALRRTGVAQRARRRAARCRPHRQPARTRCRMALATRIAARIARTTDGRADDAMLRGALIEYGTGPDRADPERRDLPVQPGVAVAHAADPAAADRRDAARDDAGRREDVREDHASRRTSAPPTCSTRTRCWRSCSASARSWRRWRRWCCPARKLAGLIGAAIDAIGDALGGRRRRRAGAADPAREVPAHPVHLGPRRACCR